MRDGDPTSRRDRLGRYVFRSEWRLPHPPEDVFRALQQLADYAAWWPEVREVTQVDEREAVLRCRSLLPYDLTFAVRQRRREPDAGVLEAALDGDLDGWSRWTIASDGSGGAAAVFDEDVVTRKPLLRRLEPVARPAFRANHWLMMRHGQQGLGAYLAGMRLGREEG